MASSSDPAARMPSMLWPALTGLAGSHADEGAGRNRLPTLDLWSNLLRVVDRGGVGVGELASLTRLSSRAARSRLGAALRHGWAVNVTADGGGPRVCLTAAGVRVAEEWPRLRDRAELRWHAGVQDPVVERLRMSLASLVARFPLEHPHYPASYGAADASVTGGPGREWTAVRRVGDGGAAALPLSALLSQVMVNFAMAYEAQSDVAFSLAARVLVKVPSSGRPLSGLAPRPWLSALVRHGYVCAIAGSEAAGSVYVLTERGRRCVDAHNSLIAEVEASWGAAYGRTTVADVRRSLKELRGR